MSAYKIKPWNLNKFNTSIMDQAYWNAVCCKCVWRSVRWVAVITNEIRKLNLDGLKLLLLMYWVFVNQIHSQSVICW
jgi:hypothetical protein